MTPARRLAAILAADVAGYSAAMERDEEGTAAAVRALRREVIEPKLQEHYGRLIKTTGDGFLAEFASPIAALNCALAIQQRPDESDGLRLRIGLNLGDVIIEESGDLLGEGVNIAARLEGLAEPGGILVSDKIVREVEGKVDAAFDDRGEQQVKNILKPVRTYAVRTGGQASATLPARGAPLALPDRPSIAVLPFQNMSGDPEQEYFADGIVEDIITALSRFRSLFVIARNSSFTYKGKAVDIKTVGRELGVRYVLEGSVRKGGGRLRVTGQLIDASTGAHLWADRFDGSPEDVFDLQDKVTETVIGAIEPRIGQAEFDRSRLKRPENLDVYDLLLRAQSTIRPASSDGLRSAIGHLQKALKIAPPYALTHGLLAECYSNLDTIGAIQVQEPEMALGHAKNGLELDRDNPEILAYAAFTHACFDSVAAGAVFSQRATVLNPNLARAWSLDGYAGMYLGQHERALTALNRALRLNPTDVRNPTVMGGMATVYFLQENYSAAIEWAEKALLELPDNMQSLRALAMSAALIGDDIRAKAVSGKLWRLYPKNLDRIKKMMLRQADVDRIADALRLAGMPE